MIKINLKEFNQYTAEDFFNFLKIHAGAFYEVVMPKTTIAGATDETEVVSEYMKAAYVGQKLSDLSVDFMHNVPEPEKEGEFSFIIMTTKRKRLANLLFFFAQAYFNDETEDWLKLEEKSADYISNLPHEVACYHYIEMVNRLQ